MRELMPKSVSFEGMTVLNVELKSMNSVLAEVFLLPK